MKKSIWILIMVFVIVLLAVLIGLVFWFGSRTKPTAPVYDIPFVTPAPEIRDDEREIIIDGQAQVVKKQHLVLRFDPNITDSQIEKLVNDSGAIDSEKISSTGYWLFVYPVGIDIVEKSATLTSNEIVESADYDPVVTVDYIPNDYSVPTGVQPWWWDVIKVPAAWDISTGSSAVKVGVADSPVSTTHDDFQIGSAPWSTSKVTSVGSGWAQQPGIHGTHVAGIIAAVTNNSVGVSAIGHDVGLLSATACYGYSSQCTMSWMMAAVQDLTTNGARVINMSFGGNVVYGPFVMVLQQAWDSGVVLVGSAGNAGTTAFNYPAAYGPVIAVAATDRNSNRAWFSNYGSWVDVAAPGVGILSTVNRDATGTFSDSAYAAMSGTSMAAPIVSGLAALCISANPNLTNAQVRDIIFANSRPNSFTQYGLIDAEETLKDCILPGTPTPAPSPTPTPGSGGVSPGLSPIPTVIGLPSGFHGIRTHECRDCGASVDPIPYPALIQCPTGQDQGQDDGTGQIGSARLYTWFDYDNGGFVEVPPYLYPTPSPGASCTVSNWMCRGSELPKIPVLCNTVWWGTQ